MSQHLQAFDPFCNQKRDSIISDVTGSLNALRPSIPSATPQICMLSSPTCSLNALRPSIPSATRHRTTERTRREQSRDPGPFEPFCNLRWSLPRELAVAADHDPFCRSNGAECCEDEAHEYETSHTISLHCPAFLSSPQQKKPPCLCTERPFLVP